MIPPMSYPDATFLAYATDIKKDVAVPVIAVGMITEPAQAQTIIGNGDADLVALARGMLYDPRWGWHAAAALGASVTAPRQYWRCEPADKRGLFAGTRVGQR